MPSKISVYRERFKALEPWQQEALRATLNVAVGFNWCPGVSCDWCLFGDRQCPGSPERYYQLLKEVLKPGEQPDLFVD